MLFLPFYFVERVLHKKSHGWKEKFGGRVNDWAGNATTSSKSSSRVNEWIGNAVTSLKPKVIMLHGCSVGEALALENLLKSIRENFPEHKIVVTTSTYAGQEIAQKKYAKIADLVTYFPFDNPIPVNRFLDKINPSAVLIVETEIWPYFAYSCKKRGIPLSIINARLSDLSYPSYRRMKSFFKLVLNNYDAVYAQSNEDKEKFISIGMKPEKVEMMGNLKFDIQISADKVDVGQEGYRVFLAGSTHKPENEIVISTYKRLREKYSDLKMMIAPRHLERVNDIKELLEKYNLSYALRSENGRFSDENDVIILDTLGELKNMYSACDLAFVGGSFNNTGGHNPLEASIFEKPVVSGPAVFNFKDIYELLSKSEAGKVVKNPSEMYEYLDKLLGDKDFYAQAKNNCKKVFEAQRGAINFVINKLKKIL